MIKLGIFGDSFADPSFGHEGRPDMDRLAWPNLFPPDQYQVTTHGAAGSSVYYSWSQFNQHQHQYDRVVFLITTTERYPAWTRAVDNIGPRHVPNWFQAQEVKRHAIYREPQFRRQVDAIEQFYMELTDTPIGTPWLTSMCELMLADIAARRPDVLFVPVYPHRLTMPTGHAYTRGLEEYFSTIVRSLRPEDTKLLADVERLHWINFQELRCCCHLTPEANQHLAGQVQAHLESGTHTWDPEIPLVLPHLHSFDYHYGASTIMTGPPR